jgi:hypothetical protein
MRIFSSGASSSLATGAKKRRMAVSKESLNPGSNKRRLLMTHLLGG